MVLLRVLAPGRMFGGSAGDGVHDPKGYDVEEFVVSRSTGDRRQSEVGVGFVLLGRRWHRLPVDLTHGGADDEAFKGLVEWKDDFGGHTPADELARDSFQSFSTDAKSATLDDYRDQSGMCDENVAQLASSIEHPKLPVAAVRLNVDRSSFEGEFGGADENRFLIGEMMVKGGAVHLELSAQAADTQRVDAIGVDDAKRRLECLLA
ncbi:hypothetical protein AWC23_08665 [Mycobacterium saskatchewanense]|uniref:Uncharacterized protein n=1 Tax=Mycobacterium saskatchewanense TaxID=220927 RepID=A0AAJ3TXE9_9MYCO|nr:hypothetical protein AWC23_08665 [Mycobacterium saskatchewanense]